MGEMETSEFHDYTTLSGRIQKLRQRVEWKYVGGIIGLLTLFVLIVLTLSAPEQTKVPVLLNASTERSFNISISGGVFTLKGIQQGVTDVIFSNDTTPITIIRIQNATIDAPNFSNFLKQFSSTLQEIYLENILIQGEFHRIYLPNIKTFVLKLILPPSNSDRLEPYQDEQYIHSRLFFNKIQDQDWKLSDIGNLGVEIVYDVHGFKFIHVNMTKVNGGEMTIYIPSCNEILKNTRGNYNVLSLAGCTVSKNSIPKNLEYLNIFDVIVSDGNISEVLSETNNLQTLFLDSNGTVDVADLPKSLKMLSISTITLTNQKLSSDETSLTNLESVSFGFNDITSVIDTFSDMFPNVKNVAMFGMPSSNYKLLKTFLNTQVPTIIVEGFNSTSSNPEDHELEIKLRELKIGTTDINFMIIFPKYGDDCLGFPISQSQSQIYRYSLLGWHNFLSANAYTTADKRVIEI